MATDVTSGNKNLVIGAAQNCGDWNALEPFVMSFKKNIPNADLVLFLDAPSPFTQNELNSAGVRIKQIPSKLRKEIVNRRWIVFKDFLEIHKEYEKIFACDVRDVIFQGDIFLKYTEHKNFLAYSTFGYKIKDEPTNYSWIKNNFGEDEVEKIQDNFVAGGSMFYGTHREINILFENIIKFLRKKTDWGDDQAITNYLVYNKILPIENIIESDIQKGEFVNLDYVGSKFSSLEDKTFKISTDKIQTLNGWTPTVIHQWNLPKFLEVVQLVDRIYRVKDFQVDKNFVDVSSAIDQMFCMIQRFQWNEDAEFLVDKILHSRNLKLYSEKVTKLRKLIATNYTVDS